METRSAANAQAPAEMKRIAVERRAAEAAIWGMPAVNYDLMLQETLTKTPGKVNEVIYWGKPLNWQNQTLTPNPDSAAGPPAPTSTRNGARQTITSTARRIGVKRTADAHT